MLSKFDGPEIGMYSLALTGLRSEYLALLKGLLGLKTQMGEEWDLSLHRCVTQ